MSKIKDIIEKNEREFEEKFPNLVLVESWGNERCECGEIDCVCIKKVLTHLHQSQLKLLEGVRAEIMKLKVFTGGSSVNEKDKRIIRQDIINLLSLSETNNKEI